MRYVYHGSGKKLKYLSPKKPVGDDDPANCKKAVYATAKKRFALAMAASRSSPDVEAFNNRKTNVQNIVKGWPDESKTVYLYVLDARDFVADGRGQFLARKKVVPVRVEEYKVSDLRHLYRKSSRSELRDWLKDREGWRASDAELFDYWVKYVHGRKIYRVFPKEFLTDVKKYGLNPSRNPYRKKYTDIKKLFNILLWLEKNYDFGHTQMWGRLETSEQIIRTTLRDMKIECLDFTPCLGEVRYYKKLMKGRGSALVSTVFLISEDILKRKVKLRRESDYEVVRSLNSWAKRRSGHDLVWVSVKGSCKAFENAIYQTRDDKGLPSCFGGFLHFKKVVGKYGPDVYREKLENLNGRFSGGGKDFFNLRVKERVGVGEIEFL
jgi:hypothetical protein